MYAALWINLSLSRNGANEQVMPEKSFQDALDHSALLGVPKKMSLIVQPNFGALNISVLIMLAFTNC